jgi:subtilisin family serine protease
MEDPMTRIERSAALLSFLLVVSAASVLPPAGPQAATARRPVGGGAGAPAPAPANPSAWFVELASLPLAEALPADEAKYLDRLRREKDDFRRAARVAGIEYRERHAYDVLWNGLSIEVAPRHLLALAGLPEVAALHPVATVEAPEPVTATSLLPADVAPELFTAITMTGVDRAQAAGLTAAGIRVGIIDTGVDYRHPDLGGGFGPGFRVAGGYDFTGDDYTGSASEPKPDDDPLDCNGHGTHVTGILAGSGFVRGAAPGATLRAYKVFGCTGQTGTDILIAAMERALLDGNQVVNMSVGAAFQWPQAPDGRAADNLVNRGVVVVTSAGNAGASGLYSASAPGVGLKAIASASVDNAGILSPSFRTAGGRAIGYQPMSEAQAPPLSGDAVVVDAGRGCNADLPLPAAVAGRVALMARGTCGFREKAVNARNAGAVAALIANNIPGIFFGTVGTPMLAFPVASLAREDGDILRSESPAPITWTDALAPAPNATGGLASPFSSIGPAPDLSLKPDLAAPGGFIFSTLPLQFGGYGFASGTSMAAPHVAGAAALLLEARPNIPSQAVRHRLLNTALPRRFPPNPPLGLDVTHRAGAGLLDLPAVLEATAYVEPGKLAYGETEGRPLTRALRVHNDGAAEVTFDLAHAPAIATGPQTFAPQYPVVAATVVFGAASLTVPARGSATVDVTITEPAGLADRGVFGGFIEFVPRQGGRTLRVPYTAFKGDYQAIPVLNPAASPHGNPLLRPNDQVGPGGPVTIRPDKDEAAYIHVHLDHAVRRIRIELFDGATGAPLGRLGEFHYVGRNRTSTEFYPIGWSGEGARGTDVPAGDYRLRLSVQRALGEDENPDHWESWTSPLVTVER